MQIDHLHILCKNPPATLLEIRDRAILLFGFASALRRSNIAGLDLAHIEITAQGAVIHIGREKQDQEGRGRTIGIPRGRQSTSCPVSALEAWLAHRGCDAGPLFTRVFRQGVSLIRLHPGWISQIVKQSVTRLGLDPGKFGGHSLRSGFITSAFEAGLGEVVISRHSGHKSLDNLKRYLRSRDPFKANACTALDL